MIPGLCTTWVLHIMQCTADWLAASQDEIIMLRAVNATPEQCEALTVPISIDIGVSHVDSSNCLPLNDAMVRSDLKQFNTYARDDRLLEL